MKVGDSEILSIIHGISLKTEIARKTYSLLVTRSYLVWHYFYHSNPRCVSSVHVIRHIVFAKYFRLQTITTWCKANILLNTSIIGANSGIIEKIITGFISYLNHNDTIQNIIIFFIIRVNEFSFNILEMSSLGVEHKKTAMNFWIHYLVEYLMKLLITLM